MFILVLHRFFPSSVFTRITYLHEYFVTCFKLGFFLISGYIFLSLSWWLLLLVPNECSRSQILHNIPLVSWLFLNSHVLSIDSIIFWSYLANFSTTILSAFLLLMISHWFLWVYTLGKIFSIEHQVRPHLEQNLKCNCNLFNGEE